MHLIGKQRELRARTVFERAGGQKKWGSFLAEQLGQNGRLFYRLAYGILRDSGAAEDICQQVMLKAWQRQDQLREEGALRGWLARAVVNESLQVRRRWKIEQRVLGHHAQHADTATQADASGELKEAVLSAMEQLPENVRLVVALRLMQGVSGNEVKELLGCSAAEVSRQLLRGMEMLRRFLADWQPA
jgi:RNA polymerase sigma-70 factor (ECF subfamily)